MLHVPEQDGIDREVDHRHELLEARLSYLASGSRTALVGLWPTAP